MVVSSDVSGNLAASIFSVKSDSKSVNSYQTVGLGTTFFPSNKLLKQRYIDSTTGKVVPQDTKLHRRTATADGKYICAMDSTLSKRDGN